MSGCQIHFNGVTGNSQIVFIFTSNPQGGVAYDEGQNRAVSSQMDEETPMEWTNQAGESGPQATDDHPISGGNTFVYCFK